MPFVSGENTFFLLRILDALCILKMLFGRIELCKPYIIPLQIMVSGAECILQFMASCEHWNKSLRPGFGGGVWEFSVPFSIEVSDF